MYPLLSEKVLQKPDMYYDSRVWQNTVKLKESIMGRTEVISNN